MRTLVGEERTKLSGFDHFLHSTLPPISCVVLKFFSWQLNLETVQVLGTGRLGLRSYTLFVSLLQYPFELAALPDSVTSCYQCPALWGLFSLIPSS
jgi:hypothetical protein